MNKFVNWLNITPIVVFVIMIQRIFPVEPWPQCNVRFLFRNCRFFYFYSLVKSAFLVSKGLLCLND